MAHTQESSLAVIGTPLASAGRAAELRRYRPTNSSPTGAARMVVGTTSPADAAAALPLVVELDGMLLNSNAAIETFFSLLGARPLAALRVLAALRHGNAAFKARLARATSPDLTRLPWNEDLISLLAAERGRGRRIYLASAADRHLVEAIAAHFGLFDGVFCSDGTVHLVGGAKSRALRRAFGDGGFDYIGDRNVRDGVGQPRPDLRTYLKAIRIHQWLKNCLLAVPMLAAKQLGIDDVVNLALAFLSFGLCASSVYVMNDLIDLGRDRAHASKRHRPFASGRLPLRHGLIMAPLFLVLAAVVAALVGASFAAFLALYVLANVGYSLLIKRKMIIDAVTLACLYGLRLLAGGAATHTPLSEWLVTFAIFIFLSLALVKRCTELESKRAAGAGNPPGRGYRIDDLPMLQMLATATGIASILIFTLYLNSKAVAALYVHPEWLSAIDVILIYWVGRTLLMAHRGDMDDDPLVFATHDRISLACAAIVLSVMALASV